jgi:RHS repeat-associated protein
VRRFRKARSARDRSQLPANWRLHKNPRTCFEGPFGELLRATGPMAKANPFRFSTQYQDDETDFLCYLRRYYNPSTGRWLSRDPITEGGGPNLYGFVSNDSINNTDVADEWGRPVHYTATIEWSGNGGFGPSYAAMIGESDNGVDSGGTSWWPIFGQEDRHLNFPSHHGMDSRDWWYNNEYRTAVNFLHAADQSGGTHLCAYASQAFGRAMHSRQDRSAHRNWPGGGDWSPAIAHPGWWDAWTDDELTVRLPSELFWRRWFRARGDVTYDTFEGLNTQNGAMQRDLQVAARQRVTTESQAAIADFVGEVRRTCVCRREMLLRP